MIQTVWRQAWTFATAMGARLGDQETALTNARRASTQLLRRRVERDEVELYLEDRGHPDEVREPTAEGAPTLPEQRAPGRVAQPRR